MNNLKLTTMRAFLVLAGFMALCSTNALGATIYVPDRYPAIQQGINAAFDGDTIIVRDGTYLLTAALDFKGKAITVKSENGASSCILDGQGITRGVYFHSGENSSSVLSGFTIQNGRANEGGGIYCELSSPTITQCIIRRNTAYTEFLDALGGGICLNSSSPAIKFCIISANAASAHLGFVHGKGGGIYSGASSPIIAGCNISGNTASGEYGSEGGGVSIDGGSPIITSSFVVSNSCSRMNVGSNVGGGISFRSSSPSLISCTVTNNSSPDSGGGIYSSASFLSAMNCIISGNSSNYAAGIGFDASTARLINFTIVRNVAATDGGGLYSAGSSPQIVNSILWENSPNEIAKSGTLSPMVTYSDVLEGYTGTGNINANPLFADIAGQDFHLTSTSPCINIGNNSAPYLPATDKDGNPRILNGTVDMGAYEYQSCALPGKANLISPSAASTTASPTYTFTAVPNATWYYLYVNDFTGTKITQWYTAAQSRCASGTGTCSVTPQIALAAGAAKWWIETWNSCGYGPWSDAASFSAGALPGAAILVSPTGPNISATPTYTWNAVPTTTYYKLWVRDYSGFPRVQSWYTAEQVGCAAGTGTCSTTPSISLVPGTSQWWVQTYNSNGYGPWSDGMTFIVSGGAGPGQAVLVSPSGNISTLSPTYKWNAVPSAGWYLLYVQDSSSFAGRISNWFNAAQAGCAAGTDVCSITPNTVLAPGAATWWIQTWNDFGIGPWSSGMSFTVPSSSSIPSKAP